MAEGIGDDIEIMSCRSCGASAGPRATAPRLASRICLPPGVGRRYGDRGLGRHLPLSGEYLSEPNMFGRDARETALIEMWQRR
ncbi:hypothetical protein ACRAWD_03865 [Caulobacter segnis]